MAQSIPKIESHFAAAEIYDIQPRACRGQRAVRKLSPHIPAIPAEAVRSREWDGLYWASGMERTVLLSSLARVVL